jgi:hypothetical protein
MEGGTQVILYHVIISIFLALILGKEENIPTNYDVGIMIFIFICTTLYGWAWVPLSWLVCNKSFPMETYFTGKILMVYMNMFFIVVISQSFL